MAELATIEKLPRWVVPALCVLVLVALGASLGGEFVWDDRPLIVESNRIKDVDRLGEILTTGFWESGDTQDRFRSFFRPLVSASYALDYALWGLNPFGFHLTNLLLHLGCTLLILGIARREGLDPRAAFLGAAVFAVHPVHVESVAWISGRTDLLASLLVLAAFLAFLRARAGDSRFRFVAYGLFMAALFSKEVAAAFPALVFAAVWFRSAPRKRWTRALSESIPFFVLLGLYAIVRSTVIESAAPLFTLEPVAWVATSCFVLARYITLLLLPLGLDAHYPDSALQTVFDLRVAIGATMVLVACCGGWRLTRGNVAARGWLLWIPLTLAPVFLFGRFGDVLLADRFLYLPSAGLSLLVAFGVAALLKRGIDLPLRGAAAITLVVLVGLTVARTRVWSDDLRLFSDMRKTSPNSALVHNNLGRALYDRTDVARSIEHFERAVDLLPGYALAHNNLAAALHRVGRTQDAMAQYREALDAAPGLMMAGANLGHLLVELGRVDEGLALLRKTTSLHPRSPEPWCALADAMLLTGSAAAALPLLDRVTELDRSYPEAFYLRGKIYLELGRHQDAAVQMRQFLEVWQFEGRRTEVARSVIATAERHAGS